jgi:tellurite resistance protein
VDPNRPRLTARGKEALVRAVVATARADGPVDETESDALLAVAAALGVTRAHLSGIMDYRGLEA